MPKMQKSEEQWRQELDPQSYNVLREKGTERAFTGEFWDTKEAGTYVCKGCGEDLFTSDAKFDSGCGWPSFYESVDKSKVFAGRFAAFALHRQLSLERHDEEHGAVDHRILTREDAVHYTHRLTLPP
jgi:peptide-methionine (R)-S-oxide reductase